MTGPTQAAILGRAMVGAATPDTADSPRRRRAPDPVLMVAAALVGVPFLLRLRLLRVRGFGPDEFEHLHFAWCVWKGMVPYRDYFEHHTPWLHYLAAPLLSLYDVEKDPEQAIAAIFMARALVWAAAGAVLLLTFLLGRAAGGPRAGALAALLLGNAAFFLGKSLEFRPDGPAAALLVGSLLLLWRGLRDQDEGRPVAGSMLAAGLALGAAVMFTQKVLFVLPGLAAALAWTAWRPPATRGARTRGLGAVALGFVIPIAVTAAYFAARGALWPFVHSNLLVNVDWQGLPARAFVRELVREDLPLVALGVAGLALAVGKERRSPPRASRLMLLAATVSLWASLLIHPAMTRHHFLLLLPPLSVCAACALVRLAALLPARAATAALLATAAAASIQPLMRFRAAFDRGNHAMLQGIRWVTRNVAPWEPVLDGFTGLGVFRPHVGFHAFQHKDSLAVQGDVEERALSDGLLGGRLAPRLIFWNHYLEEGLPAGVAPFLLANYADVGLHPIRARLFDNGGGWWSDEGPRRVGWLPEDAREPHLYVGEGWRRSQGRGRRPTAGASAELLVPVRDPGGFRVTVRAWGGPAAPCGLRLTVNGGATPPEVCVRRGWQSYTFDVPAGAFRHGLNAVRLVYPCPAACGGDADWGEGRWLLVETLALERRPAGPERSGILAAP